MKAQRMRARRAIWPAAAAGVAVLATIISITVAFATGGTSAKPTLTQRPAQTGSLVAATCAPDDSRPVSPGGEGVRACLDHNGPRLDHADPLPQRPKP